MNFLDAMDIGMNPDNIDYELFVRTGIIAEKEEPCEYDEAKKIDEWKIRDRNAELWIVKGKLQVRHRGTIHNISFPYITPKVAECEDAISRQAVLAYIEFILTHGMGKKKSFEFIKKYVENQSSVTPKQKMGRWINGECNCPVCGEDKYKDLDADVWSDWQPKFCPNCGAKMAESEEKEK